MYICIYYFIYIYIYIYIYWNKNNILVDAFCSKKSSLALIVRNSNHHKNYTFQIAIQLLVVTTRNYMRTQGV